MKRLSFWIALILCLSMLCGCAAGQGRETYAPTEEATEEAARLPTQQTEPPAVEEADSTNPPTEPPTEAPTEPPTEAPTEPPTEYTGDGQVLQYEDMKAMWLSQFDLTAIYLDGSAQRDQGDFTARMAQVLDNVRSQGFNTVFLQVRPYGDSMYPSSYYPMSSYVTGQVGRTADYDPVAIIVALAHERDLSIHAWINPMRAVGESEITLVGQDYALGRWYADPALRGNYIVNVKGRWYLNPAYGEVRDLIVSGARELLALYDFDGLHMDDYFYPTTESSFDSAAYGDYQASGGTLDLAQFRRENLNLLVAELYEITAASRPGRIFGISPAGNADTVYNAQYADIYHWCANPGYIDYICPQVYFGLEHGSFDFVKVSRLYQDMIRVNSVDLIIGMTFGKALSGEDPWAGKGKTEWVDHKDVLARCLETTRDLPGCRGISVFCYQYFFDPLTGEPIPETAQERDNFLPVLQEIGW